MKQFIDTILIDDEKNAIITLEKLLEKFCPDVRIIGVAQSVETAIKEIDKKKPNLIFLDINMPDGDGFEVLEKIKYKDSQVIFTTAYNNYAVKAFEFAALHYLLKPVKGADLQQSIERYKIAKNSNVSEAQIELLANNFKSKPEKISLPSSNGIIMVELEKIVRCESNSNYTIFILNDKNQIVVSKSINTYENMLYDLDFVRIHNQHIVNLKYVTKYVKGRGGYVILSNKDNVDVSESRKKAFLQKLSNYAR